MHAGWTAGLLALLAATVFGDLVGTQDQARDRTKAALDAHRQALDAQIDASEAAPAEE